MKEELENFGSLANTNTFKFPENAQVLVLDNFLTSVLSLQDVSLKFLLGSLGLGKRIHMWVVLFNDQVKICVKKSCSLCSHMPLIMESLCFFLYVRIRFMSLFMCSLSLFQRGLS